ELGQRLPQSTVIGETGAVSASPDATIELNMQRLDEDASGNVVLQAQASVSFKGRPGPVLRSFRFVVTPPTPDIQGEVTARRTADLFCGPEELGRQNMGELAVVIIFVTVLAPLIRLVGMLYVLIRLHERTPPGHLRGVFAWAERLRPWSMLEVFVFGVFVAYV